MLPVAWALCLWRRGAHSPININDCSGLGGGGWLSAISLLFVNAAWFITAFIILEKQFKIYGQPCPYISLTSEEADIKKAQGKGLGKYKHQRETQRLSNLELLRPKCVKMRCRVSSNSASPAWLASGPATVLSGLHSRADCSPNACVCFYKPV